MYYPKYFVELNGFEMKKLIVPLLQIIMFGMGTAMSFKDFYGVIKMPKGVFIGLVCQFSIMPILGFTLASIFNFPAEIAAGVILIGSSPSGLASNVMAYLAKANIALSVMLFIKGSSFHWEIIMFLLSFLKSYKIFSVILLE